MPNGEVQRFLVHFFDWFRRRRDNAGAQPEGSIEGYVLALTALDALASYACGTDSSAQAFRDFVLRYSGLNEVYIRVNLPLLVQYSRLTKPRSLGAIAQWVTTTYNLDEHFRLRRIRASAEDPDWNTFWNDLAASGLNLPADSEYSLKRFLYAHILWEQYRNYAVHRLTIRDEAANIAGEREPFYMNEQAAWPRFDCGAIGFSCYVKKLALHSEIRHLTPELVIEQIARALGNTELEAPPGLQLESVAQWDNTSGMWTGYLTVGGAQHRWILAEIFQLGWVNFGIPHPFILRTLGNAIDNLQATCQADRGLAASLWLNAQRRLS